MFQRRPARRTARRRVEQAVARAWDVLPRSQTRGVSGRPVSAIRLNGARAPGRRSALRRPTDLPPGAGDGEHAGREQGPADAVLVDEAEQAEPDERDAKRKEADCAVGTNAPRTVGGHAATLAAGGRTRAFRLESADQILDHKARCRTPMNRNGSHATQPSRTPPPKRTPSATART